MVSFPGFEVFDQKFIGTGNGRSGLLQVGEGTERKEFGIRGCALFDMVHFFPNESRQF